MTDTPRQQSSERQRQFASHGVPGLFSGLILLGLAVVGGAVAGAVYGIGPFKRNVADGACASAVGLAHRIAPLAHGEVAAFAVADEPLRLPDLAFHDAAGKERHLSEWRGRTLLVNLWATWCVPCRKEMPALDALEGKLGSGSFEVVAVNIDTRNPDKPRTWLKDAGIDRLGYYTDPSAKVFQDLKTVGRATGMPTTLLVDAEGCELGTVAGPAEWASADAVKLVTAALAR
jgi:thiol-disulfide isomerase/thioredoxin